MAPKAAVSNPAGVVNYEAAQSQTSKREVNTHGQRPPVTSSNQHPLQANQLQQQSASQQYLTQQAAQNPESISPELAAMIVKKYVLPMFESNERKALKSKYNKMASIGASTG
jgi:hypothetical protein